jgi:hypothetical protein
MDGADGAVDGADALPRQRLCLRRRRHATGVVAVTGVAAVVLFLTYVRVSSTQPVNTDDANTMMMAWAMLHGNVLLHGWWMSDVSFYTTELPQYALLEGMLGLHPHTAHVAAAMTYTLVVVLAVLLATGPWRPGAGRRAAVCAVIAAAILIGPQSGTGVDVLLLFIGHIGTSVPLMAILLLLDRAGPRWQVPVLAGLGLSWVMVADKAVLLTAVGPLILVCGSQVALAVWTARPPSAAALRACLRTCWYPASLAVAAVIATGLTWIADRVIRALGGYDLQPLRFALTPPRQYLSSIVTTWRDLLWLFGASYHRQPGTALLIAACHLAAVILVVAAVGRVTALWIRGLLPGGRGREPVPLVDQVLAAAFIASLTAFTFDHALGKGLQDVTIVVPFGAVLAARQFASVIFGPAGIWSRWHKRARVAACATGCALAASYLAGLALTAGQPVARPADTALASWLSAHGLHHGLAGYWQSTVVTLVSSGEVTLRPVTSGLRERRWMTDSAWYSRSAPAADFITLGGDGLAASSRTLWLIRRQFGTPVYVATFGPYTVLVYHHNLLPELARV